MTDRRLCAADRDDLAGAEALARVEAAAAGGDPEAAARKARDRFLARFFRARRREVTGAWVDVEEARKVVGLSPPARQTEGQRHRFRRDIAIAALARLGFSQRQLADVFDLPRSRIGAIIAAIEGRLA